MTFDLNNYIRPNIKSLTAYTSARDEFSGQAEVYLDANENPFPSGFNRYPGKEIKNLQRQLASLKSVSQNQLLLGNGSDESIDLILRAFCEPKENSILCFKPTYSMYKIWAQINAIAIKEVPLYDDFTWDAQLAIESLEVSTRVIFLCSPNNPTGNAVAVSEIEKLCKNFNGLVVVDEAYIDFCTNQPSVVNLIERYQNLIVIQTLSKAWGLAGLRIGLTLASKSIIKVLNKIKPPYNISSANALTAANQIGNLERYKSEVSLILSEKNRLKKALTVLKYVVCIFPSDANFLLIRFEDSKAIFKYLKLKGIVVRNRSNEYGCTNCLRISVGTEQENVNLINALKQYKG